MDYQLREDLSCCDVDGHMIFLDTAQDRYFRLTGRLEEAMRRFRTHEDVVSTLLEDLATTGILVRAQDPKAWAAIESIQRASRSAIEQPVTKVHSRLSLAIVFEVMAIVWSTRRHLKTCSLKTNLDEASAYRGRKACSQEICRLTDFEKNLLYANWQFVLARRYVPIEPVCLLDSLSLLRFLSRRGLSVSIVFGVTPEPFAAHCWVQAGDIVLNETLSDANAHTPIRKI
jgi:hypothetical protein